MRRITTIFKASSLVFLTCMYCNCAAESGQTAPDREQDPTDTLAGEEAPATEGIPEFFLNRLAGQKTSFTGKEKIKLDEIQEKRAEVWEAWKKANLATAGEKLPQLGKLSEKKAGRWQLPAELEPNAVMPYYWGYKGEGRPEKGFPLFLYLHGSGDPYGEWETGWNICSGFDDAPSAYFIPQIPNTGDYYRWYQKAKQYAWEKLLRQSLASGEIDPDRIYVFGISEGGYGSQRLASFYADYWAAAGPMAGGEPLKNAPVENCRNIGFSLRTGANDGGFYRNRLTGYTRDEFERFQKDSPESFKHNIELIPNMNHHIDYRPTTPWLKDFRRNPYPKTVSWENFEMDGRYRDGFYNLYVVERSNKDQESRTCYEMQVKDNEISLKVDLVDYTCVETDPHWGIQLKFKKEYRPAETGRIILYLCPELVDLNRPVTLTVNGRKAFQGKVQPELRHMVNSCAAFFDPQRIYPAAIEVDLSRLK